MFELNNFDSIKIGIASPEKIREWSFGEVTKPETINYRTQKPEKDGLFCEKIFGPKKDWECHCGKYKRIRYKGVVCDKCGVEVTRAKVRRERMGHIDLACPVTHIWFFRSVPSRIGTLLDITPKALEQVVYYVNYIVIDPKETEFTYKQIISDKEYREAIEKYGYGSFVASMGAEAIKILLSQVNLAKESEELKEVLQTAKGQRRTKAIKKLSIVESFLNSENKPEWMVLDVLPVLPPELRPMVQLDGGRFATSDLNDLYRRVINRNNRLKKLMELGAPDVIIRNEKRMLQESVDALIDNGKRGRAVQGAKQKDLKSLTAILTGKQGRFRQNLLGKRVDYSGRSVIAVGPELKMFQCGLPKEMALELFKPFVIKKLVEMNECNNFKTAKRIIEKEKTVVWDVLAEVIKDHPVLLNRAPTLHRLSIQAFEPILVEGRAIKLHPSVCTGFNADFDGDQMPVHVPLSIDARTEARNLMLASNNIIKLSDGQPIVNPGLDIVLGCYYLTLTKPGAKGEGMYFASEDEAMIAYQTKAVDINAEITLRRTVTVNGKQYSSKFKTSVGRIIFNQAIPQNLGLVDRTKEENYCLFEVNRPVIKKDLKNLTVKCFDELGTTATSEMIDRIKNMGYKYATLSSLTINVFDMQEPPKKAEIVADAQKKVLENEKLLARGLITLDEKLIANISTWTETTNKVQDAVLEFMDDYNPLKMFVYSGARGSNVQLNSICGMRGIMANSSGQKVDIPVKSSFRGGLSPLEYFISSRGGRKTLTDTALKTADSGYLTRRLVDVSHDVVVTEEDCFATLGQKVKGAFVADLVQDGAVLEGLEDRIEGRFVVDDVVDPKTGEVIVPANTMVSKAQAKQVVAAGIKRVQIRNLLNCKCRVGVCAKCYGKNMAGKNVVNIGEAVGVIAAQSIGEPGTQLTMRTFHTGGVAVAADITKGLPRVEELFEARNPKGVAVISEIAGKLGVKEEPRQYVLTVKSADEEAVYEVKKPVFLKVKDGEVVEPGTQLTEGSINPNDLLRIKGLKGLQDYLLSEVIMIYKGQDVTINDKHIEVIIRQMLKKVTIESSGDTTLLPGDKVDVLAYETENERVLAEGGVPATAKRALLGITKAALSTDSFLSSASFQETSRVLTDAALRGKVDNLRGLKENVIIGKLIPAGTGLRKYRDIYPIEPNAKTFAQTEFTFGDVEGY
ncbi:MAG: DNA-directed RNA polymerase subunit beta' [Clostridiales bacterium]|nr:DNA-directed RNA polymerase subunit beta' [Clostridiales bacterium]